MTQGQASVPALGDASVSVVTENRDENLNHATYRKEIVTIAIRPIANRCGKLLFWWSRRKPQKALAWMPIRRSAFARFDNAAPRCSRSRWRCAAPEYQLGRTVAHSVHCAERRSCARRFDASDTFIASPRRTRPFSLAILVCAAADSGGHRAEPRRLRLVHIRGHDRSDAPEMPADGGSSSQHPRRGWNGNPLGHRSTRMRVERVRSGELDLGSLAHFGTRQRQSGFPRGAERGGIGTRRRDRHQRQPCSHHAGGGAVCVHDFPRGANRSGSCRQQ